MVRVPGIVVVGLGLAALWCSSLRAADLPAAAVVLLDQLDKDTAAIRAQAETDIKARLEKTIKSLEQLQETFTKEGKLDEAVAVRDRLRLLKAGTPAAMTDPGTLNTFRDQVGDVLYFEVTGSTTGTVYGSGVYSTDSNLATAAVHAGAIKKGEKGVVRVTILPAQHGGFKSTGKNGVATSSWEAASGAFMVESAAVPLKGTNRGAASVRPAPENLRGYRDQLGKSFLFEVKGTTDGNVWGDEVYSDDSHLAAAAVHAGLVKDGETAVIRATIVAGRDEYAAASRNGVTSLSYGAFPGSYRLEAAPADTASSESKKKE